MTEIISCNQDWDFSRDGKIWEKVSLPHSVFTEPDEITDPQTGTAFYRYTFEAPEAWKTKLVYFEIGAAMQKSEIRLNGEYHFTHFGGYQKFFIPLTDDLQFGKVNTLDITLDNNPSRDMPPGKTLKTMDFCYHSGLYRNARLIVWEPIHISDELVVSIPAGGGVFLRTEKVAENGTASITATCHVMNEYPPTRRFDLMDRLNEQNNVQVVLHMIAPDGSVAAEAKSEIRDIRPNCDHTFSLDFEVPDAQLWSVEHPQRYTAEFTVFCNGIVTDRREERFGIRTIDFRFDGFYLNGKRILLNGTNRHMEYPFVGNALPPNAQKRDALLIQNGGHNFVRLSHYNQDPAFLEACDEIGLLVMPAIPGWQAFHGNSSFVQNAFRDCRELIRSLRNRPCVILWELSLNESYPAEWVNAEFHRLTHEEYPGPQCFSAGDTWGLYEGWDVLFPCPHLTTQNKPKLLREYGDWCFGGGNSTSRRRRGDSLHEQIVMAWNFIWSYNQLAGTPGMVGGADWCFFDYNRGCDPYIERSGTCDVYRVPKDIKFHYFRSQSDREDELFAFHDGENKLVAFSNGDEVSVARNGKEILRQKPDGGPDSPYSIGSIKLNCETAVSSGLDTSGGDPFDGGNAAHVQHPPFTFFGVEPLADNDELCVTAYRKGTVIGKMTLRKPGKTDHVETRVRTMGVAPVPGDLIFIDALLRDKNGTLVPDALPVKLNVSGAAKIIGGMPKTEAGIASWLIRITGDPATVSCQAKQA